MIRKPDERLVASAQLFKERAAVYGENYLKHGLVLQALFPNGFRLQSVNDHNRFGLLTQVVAKLTRYCENFNEGGHEDSLNDLSVYSQMLAYVDTLIQDEERTRIPDLATVVQNLQPPPTPFTSMVSDALSTPPVVPRPSMEELLGRLGKNGE